MLVYRLENKETRFGPFSWGGIGTPWRWRHTHNPPDMSGREDKDPTFRLWRKKYKYQYNYLALPPRFKFSFNSYSLVEKCFPGFKSHDHLELLEIEIDTERGGKKNYCILPDGQVVFSESIVVSKRVIPNNLNALYLNYLSKGDILCQTLLLFLFIRILLVLLIFFQILGFY